MFCLALYMVNYMRKNKKTVINFIKRLRKEMNATQAEFASAIGVGQSSVARWEQNNQAPDSDVFLCILKAYGTDEVIQSILESIEIEPFVPKQPRKKPPKKASTKIEMPGLRTQREAFGVSRPWLAESIGVSTQLVERWEKGYPVMEKYHVLLANALECRMRDLLTEE